jgi:hypothetical protein
MVCMTSGKSQTQAPENGLLSNVWQFQRNTIIMEIQTGELQKNVTNLLIVGNHSQAR